MPTEDSSTPETITERLARGIATNSIAEGAIVPFPEAYGDDASILQLLIKGERRKEIYARMNEGWSTRLHRFRAPAREVIQITLRQDHPTEKKKVVLPLRVERMVGIRPIIVPQGLTEPRPLFAGDQIASRSDATLLFVEGEKAAEAGERLFPDYVTTTWLNGANGIKAADLRPAIGRNAVIWADNDNHGRTAAKELGAALSAIGAASIRVVDVPSWFPDKWDIADPLPESGHGC